MTLWAKFKLWRKYMKLKKWFSRIQWANVILLGGQMLNNLTGTFPMFASNKYVLIGQALLGAILPSLGGVAHNIAYDEVQDPEKR